MDTVKFRVWDGKRMWDEHSQEVTFDHKGRWSCSVGGKYVCDFRNGTLMQFTGLKDKKGREIYSGDIIYCEDEMYSLSKMFSSADTGAVVFESGAFRYDEVPLAGMITGAHSRICEVIGNIYENPELIK